MLLNTNEGGIHTFNIAERRRQLTNYGEATIRQICWNKWRGYVDGVGVIEFANTPEETAKHAANCWWAALHAQPWENQLALRNVTEVCKSVKGKVVTGQPSVAEQSAPSCVPGPT
jgi:hypothetical protein